MFITNVLNYPQDNLATENCKYNEELKTLATENYKYNEELKTIDVNSFSYC